MAQFCISNLSINTKVNFSSSPELSLEDWIQHQNTGWMLQKVTICYSSWVFVWCLQSFPISKSPLSILSLLFLSHCHPFFFSFKGVSYMTFHSPSLCKATCSQSVVETWGEKGGQKNPSWLSSPSLCHFSFWPWMISIYHCFSLTRWGMGKGVHNTFMGQYYAHSSFLTLFVFRVWIHLPRFEDDTISMNSLGNAVLT